jgi:DNA-binding transcriptional ArsR family regulator
MVNHMVQSSPRLDATFTALADPTRRGILDRLGRSDASISDLAAAFPMTLTGIKKHVHVLETAGLVTTEKIGRVRTCRVRPDALTAAEAWISHRRALWSDRLDRLDAFLATHATDPADEGSTP